MVDHMGVLLTEPSVASVDDDHRQQHLLVSGGLGEQLAAEAAAHEMGINEWVLYKLRCPIRRSGPLPTAACPSLTPRWRTRC